jgi:arginase
VLDPAVMPAVDAPDEGGIAYTELELLIAGLVATPDCLGIEVTVFDPDYDPDGTYARELVDALITGLAPLARGAEEPNRPVAIVMPAQRSTDPAPVATPSGTPLPGPAGRAGSTAETA